MEHAEQLLIVSTIFNIASGIPLPFANDIVATFNSYNSKSHLI